MAQEPEPEALKRLEERLAQARAAQAPPPPKEEHYTLANLAWRMVIELVAGLAIGFGIGVGLDAVFGTRPVFLVLFTLLGFAAGVNVMVRTAREVGRPGPEARPAGNEGDGRGDGR
jgi:ATP synthase protein I